MTFKHKVNVHIINSHPRGNGTFTYRIKSFQTVLESNNFQVKIPFILYPFETHYQGISKKINVLNNSCLVEIKPKINFIQIAVKNIQKVFPANIYTKILYALHIILYRIDLWYISLYKTYKIGENDIVIASGGPGSVFRMGYELAKNSNSTLILDYRDPWNLGYNLLETGTFINTFKRKIMVEQEIKILDHAHHITTVSESLKNFFPQKYHHKITVIENGSNFEQDDIMPIINSKPEKFNINYLGTIYNDQLHNEDFFKAISDFYFSINKKDTIALNFVGSSKNENLKKLIIKYKLESITNITDRLDKEELLPYLTNASLFLQLRFKDRSKIITSKITDYLMFRKPILLPVSDGGDIEETINKYNAGYVCNGYMETLDVLNSEYQKFLNRKDITVNKKEDLSHLSRSKIAEKLIKVIENLDS